MRIEVGDVIIYGSGCNTIIGTFKNLEVIEVECTQTENNTPNPNSRIWVRCKDTGRRLHMRHSYFKRGVDAGILSVEKNPSFVKRKPIRKWIT